MSAVPRHAPDVPATPSAARQFTVVARHEWRTVRAERALVVGLVVFLVLAAYALVSGAQWQDGRDADGRLAESQSAKRNADFRADVARYEAGEAMPGKASWYRSWIMAPTSPDARIALPSLPLAALAANAGELQPPIASMRAGASRYGLLDDASVSTANPTALATGRFDAVFLLVAVLPLLLLGATYDVVARDRESGTLALVLSQPVRLSTVVLAKVAVRGAAVLLPVIAILSAGFLLVRGAPASADGWADLALLSGLVVAYGAFWLALAALVNAIGRSSAGNALTLGGLWLAFVLVIPSLLGVVTETLHPPPDRAALTNALRATLVDARRQGAELLGDWNQQHPERPVTESGGKADGFDNPRATLTTWLVRERADRLLAPVAGAFEARLDAQQDTVAGWRVLSPALVFAAAVERLAGADVARSRAFREATRAHLDRMRAVLVPTIRAGEKLRAADYDRLPRFAPDAMDQAARHPRAVVETLGLLGYGIAAAVAAAVALRRRGART